jgi:hypothetical protein
MIGVTLFCVVGGYVAWQARIVSERKALLREIVANNGVAYPATFTPEGKALSHRSPIRWLLDDWYCEVIALPDSMTGRVDEVRSLFPGVDIYIEADFTAAKAKGWEPSLDIKSWPPPRYPGSH